MTSLRRHGQRPLRVSIVSAASGLLLSACGGGGETTAACTVTSVSVSPQGPTVNVAESLTLNGSVAHQHCNPAPTLSWSSNATGVASVSEDGVVTGVTAGTAVITASAGGKSGSTTVTVQLTPVAAVIVILDQQTIAVGQKTIARLELRDDENIVVAGREVRWSVSDMSKAIVPPGSDWTLCSNEGTPCAFTGTRQVRYGANGTYAYRELTGGTPCTNAVFGDPVPNFPKQCHTAELAKTVSGGAGLEVTAIAAGTVTLTATPVVNPRSVNASEPLVVTPPVFDYVAAGGYATCARRTDGKTFCWGDEGVNIAGKGDSGGTRAGTIGIAAPAARIRGGVARNVSAVLVPTLVTGNLTFADLYMGAGHICGRTAAGTAHCWHNNDGGQLGDNTTQYRTQPVAVGGGLSFATLGTGFISTCGVTAAGGGYCWGWNGSNELGDGTTTQRNLPTPVAGGLTFSKIAVGGNHACGIATAGATYCWGYNTFGAVGDNSTTQRAVPTPVAGGLAFVDLALGFFHSCGRTTAGLAYCWGRNEYGEVGDNSTTVRQAPTPVSGGLAFVQVVAGAFTCGRTSGGAAYCWGANFSGNLGDNSTTNRSVPTPVSGGLSFVQLAVGYAHACGRTVEGALYCWGDNQSGQLGDGTTTDRLVPTLVSTP